MRDDKDFYVAFAVAQEYQKKINEWFRKPKTPNYEPEGHVVLAIMGYNKLLDRFYDIGYIVGFLMRLSIYKEGYNNKYSVVTRRLTIIFKYKDSQLQINDVPHNFLLGVVYIKDNATYTDTFQIVNGRARCLSELLDVTGRPYTNIGSVVDQLIDIIPRYKRNPNLKPKYDAYIHKVADYLDISKIYDIDVFDRNTLDIKGSRYGDIVHYRLNNKGQVGEK